MNRRLFFFILNQIETLPKENFHRIHKETRIHIFVCIMHPFKRVWNGNLVIYYPYHTLFAFPLFSYRKEWSRITESYKLGGQYTRLATRKKMYCSILLILETPLIMVLFVGIKKPWLIWQYLTFLLRSRSLTKWVY